MKTYFICYKCREVFKCTQEGKVGECERCPFPECPDPAEAKINSNEFCQACVIPLEQIIAVCRQVSTQTP